MVKPKKKPSIYVKDKKEKSKKNSKRRSNKDNGKKDIFSWIEDFCYEYLVKQAPGLPQNVIDWVVKLAPILNVIGLIFLVLRLITPFALIGFLSWLVPFAGLAIPFVIIYYLLSIINVFLMGLAAKGLFKKYQGSWRLIYYLILINIFVGLLSFNIFGVFRTIILGLVGLYIWFQVQDEFDK